MALRSSFEGSLTSAAFWEDPTSTLAQLAPAMKATPRQPQTAQMAVKILSLTCL